MQVTLSQLPSTNQYQHPGEKFFGKLWYWLNLFLFSNSAVYSDSLILLSVHIILDYGIQPIVAPSIYINDNRPFNYLGPATVSFACRIDRKSSDSCEDT